MKKYLIIFTAIMFAFAIVTPVHADQAAAVSVVDGVSAGAGFTGDVGSNNTSIAAPVPGSAQFGPVLNYFGQPLPSEGFQPVEQIVMYSCWYTDGALESMLKGVESAKAEFKIANENIELAKPATEDGETKWIKIVISRDRYDGSNFGFRGFITAKSQNKNTTMVEVVAKAALSAMENGCNVIHFTAQGAVRDVISSGWGIGFNTTQAQVYSGDLTKSNVTSGGMGYSAAKAGTRDLPWLQGFGLVDYNLEYPALKIQVKEEAPQTGNHTDAGSTQD